MTRDEFIKRIDKAIEDLFDDTCPHCCTSINVSFFIDCPTIRQFTAIFRPWHMCVGLPWFGDYTDEKEQEIRLNALLLFKESVLQYQDYRSW